MASQRDTPSSLRSNFRRSNPTESSSNNLSTFSSPPQHESVDAIYCLPSLCYSSTPSAPRSTYPQQIQEGYFEYTADHPPTYAYSSRPQTQSFISQHQTHAFQRRDSYAASSPSARSLSSPQDGSLGAPYFGETLMARSPSSSQISSPPSSLVQHRGRQNAQHDAQPDAQPDGSISRYLEDPDVPYNPNTYVFDAYGQPVFRSTRSAGYELTPFPQDYPREYGHSASRPHMGGALSSHPSRESRRGHNPRAETRNRSRVR